MVSVLETVEATIVGVLKVSNPQYLRKERVLGAVKPFSGVWIMRIETAIS